MNSFLGLENIPAHVEIRRAHDRLPPPRLLFELEPWAPSFFRNLTDLLLRRRPAAVVITSPPAPFWPDVFVMRRVPWFAFAESLLYHGIVMVLAWAVSTFVTTRPQVTQVRRFDPHDIIYYSPSEYLPSLDTGTAQAAKPQKGDPEFARQPILSVPPEADNRRQTIVTPPDIKLNHDVNTPNIVAWGDHTVPVPEAAIQRQSPQMPALPGQIVAPVPEVRETANRTLNSITQAVVAPPPQDAVSRVRAVTAMSIDVVAPAPNADSAGTRRTFSGPEAAIVEPPPAVNAASIRKFGDMNIGRSEVIAPAPQLAVPAQRTFAPFGTGGKAVIPPPPAMEGPAVAAAATGRNARTPGGMEASAGGQVVPPPPSVPGSREGGGRLIALGIHPTVAAPADPITGNRRGTFAATPDGKVGAAATPAIRGSTSAGTNGHGGGADGASSGTGANSNGSITGPPPGLHVGASSQGGTDGTQGELSHSIGAPSGNTPASGKSEVASLSKPRIGSAAPSKAELVENPSPLERQIFHDRRLYSMTLNMPNLNSSGGSWVMRFAELEGNPQKGELTAPVADHKVDPAYPMQLMRENVAGTVTLRAIIRADGSVGGIKVVNGADSRLDQYASQALARWHFHPAMKNDANVDVEAIITIPFKPILKRSAF